MIRIKNPHHVPLLLQTELLRQAGTLCDTLLTVEGLSFKAHALILALASKRLKRQLTNHHGPGPGYSCAIDSISPHTLKQILDYVYSESVEVPKDDLEELLRGAQYLEVESLVEQCEAQFRGPESPIKMDEKGVENIERKLISLKDDKMYKDSQLSKRYHPLDEDLYDCSVEEKSSPTNKDPRNHKESPHITSSPPQKKRFTPVSPLPPLTSRETRISSCAPSPSARLCWPPVSPSRSMVFNCREIMTFHSLRASQHVLAYPYPRPMYPILHRSLQPQMSSSLMGHTGLLHPYHPLIHSPPLNQDNPLISDPRPKNTSINAALTGSRPDSQERKPKVQEEREICCRHCGKPALENPWRPAMTESSSPSGEMTFRCKFCGRGGRDRRSLRSLRRGLGGEKPYQCKQCSKRFSLKHQLDTHHRVHTGEKPFECRLCGQRSRDYSAMIKHLRTHGGATPYQCTMCLEFCSSLAAMQKHLKNHPSQDFPPDWSLSSTYLYNSHT